MTSAADGRRQPFSWMLLNCDALAGSVVLKRLVSRGGGLDTWPLRWRPSPEKMVVGKPPTAIRSEREPALVHARCRGPLAVRDLAVVAKVQVLADSEPVLVVRVRPVRWKGNFSSVSSYFAFHVQRPPFYSTSSHVSRFRVAAVFLGTHI